MRLFGASALAIASSTFMSHSHSKADFGNIDTEDLSRNAICLLFPTDHPQLNDVTGIISFRQEALNEELKVVANIQNLNPNSLHGVIVHNQGDLSEGLASLGPKYETTISDKDRKHFYNFTGDLGNVKTDEKGNGYSAFTHPYLSLFGDISILGRSCVVYDKENSQTGNQGKGVAGGIIGLAEEFKNLPPS